MDASAPPPRLYLDAALRPRRSLSRRGVVLLMTPLVVINLAFGTVFLIMGAPLVPPFLGLDVAAMGLALWLSYRAARRIERVRVSADEISVIREGGGSSRKVWTSATAFTRVDLEKPGRYASRLMLWSRGKGVSIAAFLGPTERARFAVELQDAVKAAKAERY